MPAARKTAPKTETPKEEKSSAGSKANTREEFKVASDQIVSKIKELISEGNVRRIVIKQKGKTVMELPLTVAAIGVLLAPLLAAVGAFAALVSECTLEVERR